MTTAFDVAGEFLKRAPNRTLPSIKLQKLAFYAFGWYGRATGQELFSERLFAMKNGPVVSELLDLHKNTRQFSYDELATRVSVCELDDPYAVAVVDAVWATYGQHDRWVLVDMTHEEGPWTKSWASRKNAGSVRMRHNEVVNYFSAEATATYKLPAGNVKVPILDLLPDPLSCAVAPDVLERMENEYQAVRVCAFDGMPSELHDLLARV